MKFSLITTILIFKLIILSACQGEASGLAFWQATPTPEVTPTPLPTPITTFQTTISADGEIVLPLPPQVFSFQSSGLSGTLAEVYAVAGQQVKRGDPLAKVDDTTLQNALKKAEASLASLKAQIASESAPALTGDISEAEANLASAQAELARLKSLPSQEAITQAAADLKLREVELRQAQEAYDQVAYAQGVGMSPQAAELQRATLNYERAKATYDEATKPATEAQLAAARANVIQAQNRLDKLKAGLRPEEQTLNEAKLREAQLQVDEARANLAQAVLFAPWDGLITEVNAAPGVSIGSATITIAQITPLRFATSNFSERNLADIQPGEEATIYLKTYPNVPITAVIYRIELESNQKDGDTALFTVYLDFNSGNLTVRPGMTGRVEIRLEPKS